MILMLAPGPNMTFGAMPSGASYVSDQYSMIRIANDSTADEVALQTIGCFVLSPFGGWGNFGFATLANVFSADAASNLVLPGITGFPLYTIVSVFNDSTNTGVWYKSSAGVGSGHWTQGPTTTLAGMSSAIAANTAAISAETTRAEGAESTNATAISTEATARAAGDAAEATARNAAILVETTRAEAAEATNATAISTEATTRATADTTNATAITTEAATARAAEATLTTNVTTQTTKLTASVGGRGATRTGTLPLIVGDAGAGPESVALAYDAIQNDVVAPNSANRDRYPHGGKYLVSFETPNGGALGGIMGDGRHSRISSIGSPRVFPLSVTDPGGSPIKQLFVTDGLGPPRRITMSDVDCNEPEVVHYGTVAYSRADGGEPVPNQGGGGAVANFPAQNASQVATFGERTFPTTPLGTGGILYHVITYGQSLGVGSVNTGAAWLGAYTPHPPAANIKMFVGGAWPGDPSDVTHVVNSGDAKIASLVPAFDSIFPGQNYGTTGGIELCWMLAETFGLDGSNDFLYSNHSVGEQPYSALMQGTVPYNNILTCVTKAKALATAAGYAGYQVLLVYFNQGEADSATAEAAYLADLQTFQPNLTTDIYPITGQTVPALIPLFVSQKSKPSTMATVSTAELAANLVPGSTIYCAFTEYPFNYANTAHFTSFDYRVAGAYVGKVAKRVLFDGQPWKPLYALTAVRYGTEIEIQFNVPAPPLEIDPSWVIDPGNFGLQFNDSTNSAQVNGVWLKPGTTDTIKVSLTNVPTGTGQAIGIGYFSNVEGFTNVVPNFTAASQSGRTFGMRTCIHDSDHVACPGTGRLLQNYACHQTIAVTTAPA